MIGFWEGLTRHRRREASVGDIRDMILSLVGKNREEGEDKDRRRTEQGQRHREK
jgi:hypothetical protein